MVLVGERGSIMPLLIGLLGLVVLLAGGVVDLSTLYLNQRALYQVADSAALEAVTTLDQDRYYQSGFEQSVPTRDEAAVVARVIAQSQLSRARVEQVERKDGDVLVRLALDVPLPWPFLADEVTVRAKARAVAISK